MKIAKNKVATIHYTLKDKNGTVIDKSEGQEPLSYIQGLGNIIPGMENGLEGKEAGDKTSLVIAPEDAYGPRNNEMVAQIPLSNFPEKDKVQPGAQFVAQSDKGSRNATIIKVEDEEVTADFNHPLAGVELHFDVEVKDVRDATEEEIAHGHVHGAGGHQH